MKAEQLQTVTVIFLVIYFFWIFCTSLAFATYSKPEIIEEIVEKETYRIATFNIYVGGKKVNNLVTWLRNQNLDIISLNELNGWTKESLKQQAINWNHQYSAFLETNSGFHIGITSKYPIEVLKKQTEGFRHGILIVRLILSSCKSLIVASTHLTPSYASERREETDLIISMSKSWQDPLLLLGDMNSLAFVDSEFYLESHAKERFQSSSNLQRKFLAQDGNIDYSVMENLFKEFYDLGSTNSVKGNRVLDFTVPTKIIEDKDHALPMRLDFILWRNGGTLHQVSDWICEAVRSEETDLLSDHYPLILQMKL